MAHTPALNYNDIKVGDTFTFDGDTTQDPCTVTSKDDKGGTVTLESSRTGASHPYAPEFLSKVATRQSKVRLLFTPLVWIDPATGDVDINWCDTFQYGFDDANLTDIDPSGVGYKVLEPLTMKVDRLLSDLGAFSSVSGQQEISGYDAARFFRALAAHIEDVERAK